MNKVSTNIKTMSGINQLSTKKVYCVNIYGLTIDGDKSIFTNTGGNISFGSIDGDLNIKCNATLEQELNVDGVIYANNFLSKDATQLNLNSQTTINGLLTCDYINNETTGINTINILSSDTTGVININETSQTTNILGDLSVAGNIHIDGNFDNITDITNDIDNLQIKHSIKRQMQPKHYLAIIPYVHIYSVMI